MVEALGVILSSKMIKDNTSLILITWGLYCVSQVHTFNSASQEAEVGGG